MRVEFIQTRANLSASYAVFEDGKVKYHADIPLNFEGCHAGFFQNDHLLYKLRFGWVESIKNMLRDRVSANMLPFTIWNRSDELVGHVFLKRSKAFFGYLYFEFMLNNKTFYAYEIGMGKNGIKIPIYDADRQIALIEKGVAAHDNKDTYEIFGVDDFSVETAALFNLYYDFVRFGHWGEVVYQSKSTYYLYSTNKELKGKYDPEFFEKCL